MQAGADPCAESQLRIPACNPPTYPLKEAFEGGEATAAGAVIGRHLARRLEEGQAAGFASRRCDSCGTQSAPLGWAWF